MSSPSSSCWIMGALHLYVRMYWITVQLIFLGKQIRSCEDNNAKKKLISDIRGFLLRWNAFTALINLSWVYLPGVPTCLR
ncbi:hypothetical protein B0T24DRAFT_604365 [Lasiosphaeria ovina]|uniref:Uncharacterized protein n=1 Tax=Lasiosphaeria ovina TaxID=92902 RepID=A0AAE0NKX5_9PEZI|nr:hypothetical protein B0T24DRAFT_604365 [Lasiosphaeria ovina]